MLNHKVVAFVILFLGSFLNGCGQHNNTNKIEKISTSTHSEEQVPTSKELMHQFIKTFPELKSSDFPQTDTDEDAFSWLLTWQSNDENVDKYIARSDYKDWFFLIEESINELAVVGSQKIHIAPRLTKMYSAIENLEKNNNELDLEEVYTAYYENVLDVVLQHKYDVIGLDNGENAEFILANSNNTELPKLAKMLALTSPESQVTLYQSKFYPEKYVFEFTADKLGK